MNTNKIALNLKAAPKLVNRLLLIAATFSFALASINSSAGIISNGFGINGNFVNNDKITTEYRADGTVWEWLDLTVTNQISFSSLKRDIQDDEAINNSSQLISNSLGFADIFALTTDEATGWSVASSIQVSGLINSFLGTRLGATQSMGSAGSLSISQINPFIELFGDTFQEQLIESTFANINNWQSQDWDGDGVVDGEERYETLGLALHNGNSVGYGVRDGLRLGNTQRDGDWVGFRGGFSPDLVGNQGTWLTRQIISVSAPSTGISFIISVILLGRVYRSVNKKFSANS